MTRGRSRRQASFPVQIPHGKRPIPTAESAASVAQVLRSDLDDFHINHGNRLIELMQEKQLLQGSCLQMAELAELDFPTKLPNRRSLNRRLEDEWSLALRHDNMLSILMIDVDHFKRHNDAHGHLRGDRVLVELVSVFRKSLKRPRDFAARHGGEEFVVILPHTSLRGAIRIAEAIRSSVLDRSFLGGDIEGAVTISVGVAAVQPRSNGSIAALINAADWMLYRANIMGRNQVQAPASNTSPDSRTAAELCADLQDRQSSDDTVVSLVLSATTAFLGVRIRYLCISTYVL